MWFIQKEKAPPKEKKKSLKDYTKEELSKYFEKYMIETNRWQYLENWQISQRNIPYEKKSDIEESFMNWLNR